MGAAPCGYGSPAPAPANTAAILAKPDGTQGDAVALDPSTGDYQVDAYGNKVGGDSVAQMVYLALSTQLGSCAEQSLGLAPPGGNIRADTVAKQKQAVQGALANLVGTGVIQIVSINVSTLKPGTLLRTVKWRRTSTGQTDTTVV